MNISRLYATMTTMSDAMVELDYITVDYIADRSWIISELAMAVKELNVYSNHSNSAF